MFQEQYPLQSLHSLGFRIQAAYFAEVHNESEIPILLEQARRKNLRTLLIGEGSNLFLTKDFPGLILHIKLKGIEHIKETHTHHYLKISAGENWHQLVCYCLKKKIYGLENLSLIPGSVGAAPVQNIGAYGVSLSDFLVEIEAYDMRSSRKICISKEDCQLGYRSSLFKSQSHYLITSITLCLPKTWTPKINYQGLKNKLNERNITHPTAKEMSHAVVALRQEKLPDPKQLPNAGSFFKNPSCSATTFADLLRRHPFLKGQPTGLRIKLSAAQLIEACGWKGYTENGVGTYAEHALVLVHYGQSHPQQLLQLARRIEASVAVRFGIKLETEVRIV